MARHKKNESAVLVKVVNDYYENDANGDTRKLKYSNLARYAEAQGIHAAWYDFQRDKAVVQRIAELTASDTETPSAGAAAAYKSLDIDAVLTGCRTVQDLKQKLYELDNSWRLVYDSAVRESAQNRELSAKVHELEESNGVLERQTKELKRENVYLRRMLRENLYPAVANELLRMSHLPVPENDTVRPEAFRHLIEPETPRPLDGAAQSQPQKLTRQEQLLADMRNQVKRHE